MLTRRAIKPCLLASTANPCPHNIGVTIASKKSSKIQQSTSQAYHLCSNQPLVLAATTEIQLANPCMHNAQNQKQRMPWKTRKIVFVDVLSSCRVHGIIETHEGVTDYAVAVVVILVLVVFVVDIVVVVVVIVL